MEDNHAISRHHLVSVRDDWYTPVLARFTPGLSYRIEAKSEDPPATHAQLLQMLQALLADQFKLQFHRGTESVPGFALVVAKKGSKLKEPAANETENRPFARVGKQGQLSGPSTVSGLVELLSVVLRVPVTDQTGLTGRYEIDLKWASDDAAGPASADAAGPSIFTAFEEQLGLRLESAKDPVELLVIDHAEKPPER